MKPNALSFTVYALVITLIVSFSKAFAAAGGGVDIGNGGKAFVGLLNGKFTSEENLRIEAQYIAREVSNQEFDRARSWINQGDCDPVMHYDSTELYRTYDFENGEFVERFWGYTRVGLDNCLTPENIEGDELPEELRTEF
ncbi:MAG: hypothetical protein HRT45_07380 [Bdellovibrionales bacterium]|nr:hypothetical protein [Bdellovibrionales bacterium]